ncbi:hypothetical protein LX32DRAFT_251614 [Colletotrichum zoysiae]|uniref:Uncharacterized protein n=1 Tax=Colletotrichum zoysiae TaxID=1216348 RepID=A0AAD9LX41_9PEZI|nr:hypothetical protein LX32DRAFT_251614 [Colletotrichum zoysiae]
MLARRKPQSALPTYAGGGSIRLRSLSTASSVRLGYTTAQVGVPPLFTPSAGNISPLPTRAAVEPTLDYPAINAVLPVFRSYTELSNDDARHGRLETPTARHRCPALMEYGRKKYGTGLYPTSLFTTLSGSSRRRPLPEIVRTANGMTGQYYEVGSDRLDLTAP